MTKEREALKLALEALESWNYLLDPKPDEKTITAIKEALAQPVPRPWVSLTGEEISQLWISTSPYFNEDDFAKSIEDALRSKNT